MQPIKWLKWVIYASLISCLLVFAFNAFVDPFGVFGDRFFNFYAYNMNNNPRVAKIAYLDRHHKNYNAYVIGGSKSSSLSPDLLNQYFEGASFYNMMMYGGDFFDYEKTIHYLVENYEVKHIVLHMSMQEIDHYNQSNKNINTELSEKVLSNNAFKYTFKYLTLNLEHGFKKIQGAIQRLSDPMAYATFIPESGVYNKSVRDAEDLGSLESFLEKYPEIKEPLWALHGTAIDDNVDALERIKNYLAERDIRFTFVSAPTYHIEMDRYDADDIRRLWRGITDVTEFWDFTGYNALSYDARNFYDNMHYRNSMGNLMIQKMFGDAPIPVDDFGHLTTKENVEERLDQMLMTRKSFSATEPIRVPIIMYHDIIETVDGSNNRTLIDFENDLRAFKEAGYTTIHYQSLIDYVYSGIPLPTKPLILTFDDGYLNNYKMAYPLLKKYDMKAVISIIGWSVGLDYDTEKNRPINPHFTWEEASEMVNSGVIEIQSHSYDLHEVPTDPNVRSGVLQQSGEDVYTYMDLFKSDHFQLSELTQKHLNVTPQLFTYPYGFYNPHTEGLLSLLGYKGSVTTESGVNLITQNPKSLFALKRIDASSWLSTAELLEKIEP